MLVEGVRLWAHSVLIIKHTEKYISENVPRYMVKFQPKLKGHYLNQSVHLRIANNPRFDGASYSIENKASNFEKVRHRPGKLLTIPLGGTATSLTLEAHVLSDRNIQ